MARNGMLAAWLLVMACMAAGPAATKPSKPEEPKPTKGLMETVLPEANFDNVQLEDAMAYLQDVVPDFRAVVLRDPGAEGPILKFRVKKVDLSQLLNLIQMAAPNVELSELDGNTGSIHVFKVHVAEANEPGAVGPFGQNPLGGAGVAPGSGAAALVHVYRLSDVVDGMVQRRQGPWEGLDKENYEKLRKEALTNVLSLIKATLAQTDGADGPVLQVHEETQTLIFKGRETQRTAVDEVLSALQPAPTQGAELTKAKSTIETLQRQVEEERRRAAESVEQAKVELASLRLELQSREKEYRNQAVELDRMKAKVEDQQAKLNLLTGESKKP